MAEGFRKKKKKSFKKKGGDGGFKPSSIFRHNKETGENKSIDIRYWDSDKGENVMFEARSWVSGEEGGERISTKLEPFEIAMLGIEFTEVARYEMRKKHDIPKREILHALNDPDVRKEIKRLIAEVLSQMFEDMDEEEEE